MNIISNLEIALGSKGQKNGMLMRLETILESLAKEKHLRRI